MTRKTKAPVQGAAAALPEELNKEQHPMPSATTPQDVFDCIAAEIPREKWPEVLETPVHHSLRVNSWTPKSAIFGDDAARVLGLQVTALVLYQLTAILDREEPDDWPSAAADSSLAVQIATEEVQRIEKAIHAGQKIYDIHHALIRLGCLLRCAWLAYTPQASTYPGRVLERLPDSINAFCHLLEEVIHSPHQWAGDEEGGHHGL